MMIRISFLSMMFALAVGAAGAQQLPLQPPPVASLMGQGNDQERAACHPRRRAGFVKPNCRSILMTCWGFWAVCRRTGPRSAVPAGRYWRTTVNKPTQARAIIMRRRSASGRRRRWRPRSAPPSGRDSAGR